MTTALEGGEGSASRPGHSLPPGKTRYPLYRRLGGPQGRSGKVRKISPPLGFDPRTVQPVASHYTDWATRPTNITKQLQKVRQPEVGCCIVVVWWELHKDLQCQKFGSKKKSPKMSEDPEIQKCTHGCWEAFLTLHTSLGRENAQVRSRKYGKDSCN